MPAEAYNTLISQRELSPREKRIRGRINKLLDCLVYDAYDGRSDAKDKIREQHEISNKQRAEILGGNPKIVIVKQIPKSIEELDKEYSLIRETQRLGFKALSGTGREVEEFNNSSKYLQDLSQAKKTKLEV